VADNPVDQVCFGPIKRSADLEIDRRIAGLGCRLKVLAYRFEELAAHLFVNGELRGEVQLPVKIHRARGRQPKYSESAGSARRL